MATLLKYIFLTSVCLSNTLARICIATITAKPWEMIIQTSTVSPQEYDVNTTKLKYMFLAQLFKQYPCTDLHCYIYCKTLLKSTPFYPRLGEVGWKPGCKPYWIVEYKFIITSFEEFLNSTTSKVYIVQATKLQVWETSKKMKMPSWHFISIHRFKMLEIRIFKSHI